MALILDPTRQLFGDRIISQTDSTKRLTKDLDVVLGAESAVVILDDTEGVWPNHKANLLLMERYHFFTSSCTQFGLRAPSYVQLHRDESESEGCLATTLRTLRAIHHEFFNGHVGQGMKRKPSSDSADVRQIIRRIRGKLLAGCSIVLGSELHREWKLPAELGARCSTYCDQTTTHVVTLDPRSDKAMWAKEHGVFLVHPKWVDAACYLWKRPPEEEYPVPDGSSATRLTKVSFSKSVSVELPGVNGGDKGEIVHANGSSGV
jgi:RNA polymerase II C-terminal domain phosphatase-like 3/4